MNTNATASDDKGVKENSKKNNRRKRGPGSPAEGASKDPKRQNQTGTPISSETDSTHTTGATMNMEDAVVEVAARVGECVTAHGDIVPNFEYTF